MESHLILQEKKQLVLRLMTLKLQIPFKKKMMMVKLMPPKLVILKLIPLKAPTPKLSALELIAL